MDGSTAGKKADAEYKKIEQDYMTADAQARILIRDQKTVLDELAVGLKNNAAHESERSRRLLKALRAPKQ